MAMSLSRFSNWIWPGSRTRRARDLPAVSTVPTTGLFPDSPSGFREPDAVRLPSSAGSARGRGRAGPEGPTVGSQGSTGSTTWSLCRPTAGVTCQNQTLTTPTGPSVGLSRRRPICRSMGTLRVASPSSCHAIAAAASSSLGDPTAVFLVTVVSPAGILQVAIIV